MTKGIKTSEFWITLTGVGAILWQFLQQNCTMDSSKVFALASLIVAYVASRTVIKGVQTMQSTSTTVATQNSATSIPTVPTTEGN